MKKILVLILTLNITANIFAQIDTTKVAFVSYWSIGDSYDFKVTKSDERWKEGVLIKDQKQEYLANFTVLDSTESSYTIRWSYENNLESEYDIPEELLEKFSKYELTEVMYKTSEVGDFIEVLNWEEIGESMNNMFDDIINLLGGPDEKNKLILKKRLLPIKQMFSSKQGIEQIVLKELQYFHLPMGVEYDVSEPIYYEEEVPNMFGGKPIKSDSKLYFEKVDFEDNFCILKQEMNLDPDGTREMLREVFKQMKLNKRGIKKALKNSKFQITDNNTFEYFYNPGIPYKIETIREVLIDIQNEKIKRIDKITIEWVYE